METTPISLTLAWWATAWLRGHVPADDLLDAVSEHAVGQVLIGSHQDATGLLDGLAGLRADGVREVGAAYPVPGDPVGLGGPPGFNEAALEAGEAVVAGGVGWVPTRVGQAYEWSVHPAERRSIDDLGEADRLLRRTVLRAADRLARAEVVRWDPDLADELLAAAQGDIEIQPPPGIPIACGDLAARALRWHGIALVADTPALGAISAHEQDVRRDGLAALDHAARVALCAAASPQAWPPG